jgi:hypothetical protein
VSDKTQDEKKYSLEKLFENHKNYVEMIVSRNNLFEIQIIDRIKEQ